MTITDVSSNGNTGGDMPVELTDGEARMQARDAYRRSVRDGTPLKGSQLGPMFDRSAAWGQKQIRAVEAEGRDVTADDRVTSRTEAIAPIRDGGRDAQPSRSAVTRDVTKPRPASRPTETRAASPAVRRVTAAAVTLVAAVAAATSYSHMHDLALEAGEGALVARALPLSVDGLVVAATMALLAARRTGRGAGVLPWAALLLGLGASLAANVAAAEPTVVGRLVAAWPPVALAVSFELLLRQTRGER